EGKFEDLQGKGKPLVIDTSPDAVIKGILKEANVTLAPEWITLASEIERLLEQEQQLLESYATAAEADLAVLMGSGELAAAEATASTSGFEKPAPPGSPGLKPRSVPTKPAFAGWAFQA